MDKPSTSPSFEWLRDEARQLLPATAGEERTVVWLDRSRSLAVARDPSSRLELFLTGPTIDARLPSIDELLVYDTWTTSDGRKLHASRLRLPPGGHLDSAAALICTELLDNGYADDPAIAFARSEPLIDLVLTPASRANQVLTGLAGELQFLAALLHTDFYHSADQLLSTWHGWRPSARDFQLGSLGIEVKTTTTSASTHHIQGWYQVETGVAADGTAETALYLLSVGLRWLAHDSHGATIEGLTAEIANRLSDEVRATFLDNVRRYAGSHLEIDSAGAAGQKALRRPFMLTFERLYDMSDDLIDVPRAADIAEFSNVVSDSVSFTISLPKKVRGDRNPTPGFPAIVQRLQTEDAAGES